MDQRISNKVAQLLVDNERLVRGMEINKLRLLLEVAVMTGMLMGMEERDESAPESAYCRHGGMR